MKISRNRVIVAWATAIVAVMHAPISQALDVSQASFTWLGSLPGDQISAVHALSDDGSTIVGSSYANPNSPTGVVRAFRWTRETGLQVIGDLAGGNHSSEAVGVSGDGSVIVGSSSSALSYSNHPYYHEPFMWSAGEGMKALGYLPGTNGRYGGATAVSGNGAVVVGTSTGDNGAHPFRWSAATGMVDLGDLDSNWGNQDSAFAVNSDGTVIVGMSQLGWDRTAFRWTAANGMQPLGTLLTSASGSREQYSVALSTSEDGSVVVGSAYSDDGGIEAFRWTATSGMQGLGKLPQAAISISDARAVSADGNVIVGSAIDAQGQTRAILWNQAGMHALQDLLVEKGAASAIGNGHLIAAVDISTDGRTIIGSGYGPAGEQAWIATLVPEPSCIALLITGAVPVLRRCRCSR